MTRQGRNFKRVRNLTRTTAIPSGLAAVAILLAGWTPPAIENATAILALPLFVLAANGYVVAEEPEPFSYVPQSSVPQLLHISWSAGPPMPQGMQDNYVGFIDGWLVSAGGFCGGGDDDWKPGKYPRGFLNKVWGLQPENERRGWVELPPFPGAPRQGMLGATVADALYIWGGISYSPPFTYEDGFLLSHSDDTWDWKQIPPLPSPLAWSGVSVQGAKIYVLGGCDYDGNRFYTLNDRAGKRDRLGSRLFSFNTERPQDGWTACAPCPGTPRCLASTASVDGKLYFLGGVAVTATEGTYCNVVDSWRYDPITDTWERLRDLPISGSGGSCGNVVYKGRYLLLPCGYQYETVMRPDGTITPKYGNPGKVQRTWVQHPRFEKISYFNHCYVYDTVTGLYGTATPLPFDDVASITVILDDVAYMFPGETGGFVWNGEYFGHHPEFVLKGTLQETDDSK